MTAQCEGFRIAVEYRLYTNQEVIRTHVGSERVWDTNFGYQRSNIMECWALLLASSAMGY